MARSIFPRNRRLLAFGFLMMFWSGPGQTYLISLYGGELRASFGLSHSEFGAVYSAGTLMSAALLIWSGRLVDRVDLAKLSMAVVLLLGCALWWISFSTGAAALVIGIFLLRHTGQGLMTHIGGTTMVRYFEGIKGKTTAFARIGYVAAEAILPVLTISVIAWLGWREALRASGAVLLLIMVPAIVLLLRNHRRTHQAYLDNLDSASLRESAGTARTQWTRRQVLLDRRFYMAIPALTAASLLFTGFFFHQVHLVEAKDWPLLWWGQMFALYAGAAFVSTVACGPLIDRVGAVRLLWLCNLPFAVGLFLLFLSSHMAAGVAFLVLTGITTGAVSTMVAPFWSEVYGTMHLGAIKSVGSAVAVFSSALSPFALGWLIDAGISMETLALVSAAYIVAAALLAHAAFSPLRPLQPGGAD